jgi:hypothetical protein
MLLSILGNVHVRREANRIGGKVETPGLDARDRSTGSKEPLHHLWMSIVGTVP